MFESWRVAADLSAWQGPDVDAGAAKAGGVEAWWLRCGYGDDRHPEARRYQFGKDGMFDRYRQRAKAAGLPFGFYIFPIPHASTPQATFHAVMRYTR